MVERLLDRLDASARFALLKLVTGGLRVGVSARLAKAALADLGGRDVAEIEELWHGLTPPYAPLFAWLTGAGAAPGAGRRRAVPPGDALARRSTPPTSTASTPPTSPPNGNGTASASRPPPRPAAAGSTPAPATTSPPPSPTSSRR